MTAGSGAHGGTSVRPSLTRAGLGRALLARQHLLARHDGSALDEVTHLVGLQSQAPSPPYVGLWTRLAGFEAADLSDLLRRREVVRMATLRSTIHATTAADARWLGGLGGLLEPLHRAAVLSGSQHREHLRGLDLAEVQEAALAALADGPLSPADLGSALALRWPQVPATTLAQTARAVLPLVQVTPRGLWGASGTGTTTRWAVLEEWVNGQDGQGAEDRTSESSASAGHSSASDDETPLSTLLLRYLAAFGPATVADAQRWCGLTGLRAAVAPVRDLLVSFVGPDGSEVLDLREAPRPEESVPAPVRFLPEWDNLLLSHVDRSRVVTEERRRAIFSANGIVASSVLVDGQVQLRWSVERTTTAATLVLQPLAAELSSAGRREVEDEGMRLLAFTDPGLASSLRWEPDAL